MPTLASMALTSATRVPFRIPVGPFLESDAGLVAGLGVSVAVLGAGVGLRRSARRKRPGRHRATRKDRAEMRSSEAGDEPHAAGSPAVDLDVSADSATELDESAALREALEVAARASSATPDPAAVLDLPEPLPPTAEVDGVLSDRDRADLEALDKSGLGEADGLDVSPLTGQKAPAQVRRPSKEPSTGTPQPRVRTTGAAVSAEFEDLSHDEARRAPMPADIPAASPVPARSGLDPLERANRLADAWESRDVDELAALASADDEASLAAFVLAGAAAHTQGDPRAYGYLQAAYLDGREPLTEPLLGPYLDQITLHLVDDDLGLDVDLPCSRTGIGCALAGAERLVGDHESAYGVLLELPDSPLVCALRAQAALDLQWPARALRSVHAAQATGLDEYASVLQALEGFAQFAAGDTAEAIGTLAQAASSLAAEADAKSVRLQGKVLFSRALAKIDAGDHGGAWEDLTVLLADYPGYPGAAALLKSL